MRRVVVLSLTLLLLWAVVAELNHALGEIRVYLFTGGLFVSFTALTQPLRAGLVVSCIGGLLCDANSGVKFGTHLLLFATAHVTIFHVRDRIPRDDTIAAIVLALLTNLGLFLVFSFTQIHQFPAPAAAWPRLLADLVASQIFLTLVTPWFFALQARTVELIRVTRDEVA